MFSIPFRQAIAPHAVPFLLFVLALVGVSCTRMIEPPQDARLVAGLETLAAETDAFAAAFPSRAAGERQATYAALDDAAAALIGWAEARNQALAIDAERQAYAVATAGFLEDFRRNLALLAARDAEAGRYGLLQSYVALRFAAMRDALDDALYYERVVLDRSH
jgi:hypothetical protein